ncbi:hypothetical protein C2G38_2156255 [Gigaspora rosea]|uniref:Uncharacterized protein n=1 Tax=Gigaspora rosea TaxID=44941 RepID=A0A397W6V7_9GLOM|nr:hypothetical protein C2G38_2156255 [Gigaspora rosea]
MDNKISHCSNDDIDFTLPFNDTSSVIRYIDKGNLYKGDEFINGLTTLRNIDDVFESGDFEYWSNFSSKNVELIDLEYRFNLASVIGNVENNAFESNDLEYRFNFAPVIENVDDNICESDSEDESKDSP